MAEILLCVKDKPPLAQRVTSEDWAQPQQGDVIVVLPNGWGWSVFELGSGSWRNRNNGDAVEDISTHPQGNHNFFRVIKLPNVSVAAASTLLAPELPLDPLNPSPFLQYRGFFLDKSKIPPATMQNLLDHWNDDGRVNGFLTLDFTAAQINTIVSQRDRVAF